MTTRPPSVPIVLFVLVVLPSLGLLSAGCSSTRLAYNNADWYLVREVSGQICPTDAQRDGLKRVVADLLRWHRRQELPRYARALRHVATEVRRGPVTHKLLLETYDVLDGARIRATRRLAGPLVAFGITLGGKQVGCIALKLDERHRERLAELEGSAAAYRARHGEKMVDRLEPWVGDLSAGQQATLTALLPSQAEARAVARAHLHKGLRLISALSSPHADKKRAWLRAWVTDPYALYSDAERRMLTRRDARNRAAIWPLVKGLTERQRLRFADKLLEYARDFEALAAAR